MIRQRYRKRGSAFWFRAKGSGENDVLPVPADIGEEGGVLTLWVRWAPPRTGHGQQRSVKTGGAVNLQPKHSILTTAEVPVVKPPSNSGQDGGVVDANNAEDRRDQPEASSKKGKVSVRHVPACLLRQECPADGACLFHAFLLEWNGSTKTRKEESQCRAFVNSGPMWLRTSSAMSPPMSTTGTTSCPTRSRARLGRSTLRLCKGTLLGEVRSSWLLCAGSMMCEPFWCRNKSFSLQWFSMQSRPSVQFLFGRMGHIVICWSPKMAPPCHRNSWMSLLARLLGYAWVVRWKRVARGLPRQSGVMFLRSLVGETWPLRVRFGPRLLRLLFVPRATVLMECARIHCAEVRPKGL